MKAGEVVKRLSNVHPDTKVLFNTGFHPRGKSLQYEEGVNIREEQAIQLSPGEFDFLSNHFDVQGMEEQYLQDGDSGLDFFSVVILEEA